MMTQQKIKAFTLVELIVVVTILAILATIGFVSYSGYLTGVRDTNRIASLTSISDGLELYRTKQDLPQPDDSILVKVDGTTIARQGYLGSNVLESIEYNKAGKDPKDDVAYSYYLTDNNKYYQLMTFLEESYNLDTQVLNQTNAVVNYENRYPKVYGKKLGILTDTDKTPIQEVEPYKSAGEINFTTGFTGSLNSYLKDDVYITGSGAELMKLGQIAANGGKFWTASSGTLVSNDPVNTNSPSGITTGPSCKTLYDSGTTMDGTYTINPGSGDIEVYCDMSNGGWTRVIYAPSATSNLPVYSSSVATQPNATTGGLSPAYAEVKGTQFKFCNIAADLTEYNGGNAVSLKDALGTNITKDVRTLPLNTPYLNAIDTVDGLGESARITIFSARPLDYFYYAGSTWGRSDSTSFDIHNQNTDSFTGNNCWPQHVWVR